MSHRIIHDFLLGFIKIHILYYAQQEAIFGHEFKKELERYGYDISYGTLYSMFHKLEKQGYLRSKKENVKGKTDFESIKEQGKRTFRRTF